MYWVLPMTASRTWTGLFALLLVSLLLSSCTLDNTAAQQDKATGLWGELVGGETFGQSFMSTRDNLYRIDLGTATYARPNTAPVIFHLRASPLSDGDIVTLTLPASEIQNDRPTTIEFKPLKDSAGKTFYLSIESPEATPGNAITVYANSYDQYPDGTAYRSGQPVGEDLAFTAYSQEKYTPASVWGVLTRRVRQDIGFSVCYGAVLLAVLAFLIVFFCKRCEHNPG